MRMLIKEQSASNEETKDVIDESSKVMMKLMHSDHSDQDII